MIDENTTPPPLKGKTLAEIHKERQASKPDVWTLAWWKSQIEEILKAYRGLCHTLSLAVANMQEYAELVERLEKRLESVETENKLLMAQMGELQAEVTIAKRRIDDMADWAKKQKATGKQEKTS